MSSTYHHQLVLHTFNWKVLLLMCTAHLGKGRVPREKGVEEHKDSKQLFRQVGVSKLFT